MKFLLTLVLYTTSMIIINAQPVTFQRVDSLSYAYYTQQNWDSLIYIAEKGLKNNIDSYYIKLRLGTAYFSKNRNIKAERILLKTFEQNPTNEFNTLMLHYNSLQLSDYYKTQKYYYALSDSTQKHGVKIAKAITASHILGGFKRSSDGAFRSTFAFTSFGLGHSIGKNITLYESYTHIDADNKTWGNWAQDQLYLSAMLHTKKGQFEIATHGYRVNSNIHTFESTTIKGSIADPYPFVSRGDSTYISQQTVSGKNQILGIYNQLGYYHRYRGLSFGVFGGMSMEKTNPTIDYQYFDSIDYRYYNAENQIIDSANYRNNEIVEFRQRTRFNNYILGATLSYSQLLRERLTLGVNIYKPLKNKTLTYAPFFNFRYKRVQLSGSYFTKGAALIAEQHGAILNNAPDIVHHRAELAIKVNITKLISLSATYQYENRTDDFSSVKYTTNSLSGGITVFW
ncbi:MAG: hypothetical protein RBR35_14355 [Salinivirgaceae bacterium]|nr:hypothetical protein [Salinivirgaceae bacterium]